MRRSVSDKHGFATMRQRVPPAAALRRANHVERAQHVPDSDHRQTERERGAIAQHRRAEGLEEQ